MNKLVWMILPLFTTGLLVGCGQGKPAGPLADVGSMSDSTGTPQATTAAPASAAPADIVTRFYEALRRGDDQAISSLLTDVAREETAKNGLGIRSQASASLTYEIGETDFLGEDLSGAHVASLWNQEDEEGGISESLVVWVLRRQTDGWRVSGMATPVAEGQLPLLFNFEDPEDMLRKKELVEQEVASDFPEPVYEASLPEQEEVAPADYR